MKVYRIWDSTLNDWYKGNRGKTIWARLSGVRTILNYKQRNRVPHGHLYIHEFTLTFDRVVDDRET